MKKMLWVFGFLIALTSFSPSAEAQRIFTLQLQGVQTGENVAFDDWLSTHFYGAPAFTSAQIAHHALLHPGGTQKGYIAGPTLPYIPGTSITGPPPLGCNGFTSGC